MCIRDSIRKRIYRSIWGNSFVSVLHNTMTNFWTYKYDTFRLWCVNGAPKVDFFFLQKYWRTLRVPRRTSNAEIFALFCVVDVSDLQQVRQESRPEVLNQYNSRIQIASWNNLRLVRIQILTKLSSTLCFLWDRILGLPSLILEFLNYFYSNRLCTLVSTVISLSVLEEPETCFLALPYPYWVYVKKCILIERKSCTNDPTLSVHEFTHLQHIMSPASHTWYLRRILPSSTRRLQVSYSHSTSLYYSSCPQPSYSVFAENFW